MAAKSLRQNDGQVLKDAVFARMGVIIGWIGIFLWTLLALGGFSTLFARETHENPADYYMPYVCVVLVGLHIWRLVSSKRKNCLIRDFRSYCAILAHEPDKSIPDLAATLHLPVEDVEKRIKAMCDRHYFNGYFDFARKRMVFSADTDGRTVVHCPGCGAANAILTSGDACRYCGAPLSIKH